MRFYSWPLGSGNAFLKDGWELLEMAWKKSLFCSAKEGFQYEAAILLEANVNN